MVCICAPSAGIDSLYCPFYNLYSTFMKIYSVSCHLNSSKGCSSNVHLSKWLKICLYHLTSYHPPSYIIFFHFASSFFFFFLLVGGLCFTQSLRRNWRGEGGLKWPSSSVPIPAHLSPTRSPSPSPGPSAPAGTSAGNAASPSLLLFRSESLSHTDISSACHSQNLGHWY